MVGNSKIVNLMLMLTLLSCINNKKLLEKNDKISLKISNKYVTYNSDVLQYYLINKSNKDILILCNSEYFKRGKDSIRIDTWFSPELKILEDNNDIQSEIFSIDYTKKNMIV